MDLESSKQDTFQAGTFAGFPKSHFAPPALSSIFSPIFVDFCPKFQITAFSLVKSRLALGSPGWLLLFVTMPKMTEYTEK